MDKTYSAVYYLSPDRFYNATIFLSSITISIRYKDENNNSNEVYWLAVKVTYYAVDPDGAVHRYTTRAGR